LITGRVFGAQEALDAGLLHSIHAPDALLETAYALAAQIIMNTAPVAVAITRQMVYRMSPLASTDEVHRLESQLVSHLVVQADAVEGVASFLEKRAPEFPTPVSKGLPNFLPWVDAD
jgi:enoyl-CoA hydratase/carnithine racemase